MMRSYDEVLYELIAHDALDVLTAYSPDSDLMAQNLALSIDHLKIHFYFGGSADPVGAVAKKS